MKKKDRDVILIDVVTQNSIEISEENFDDLQLALGFMLDSYRPKNGVWRKNVKALDDKFWKFKRSLK